MSGKTYWKRRCFICDMSNKRFEVVEIRLHLGEIREVGVCINSDINNVTKCQEKADAMEAQ